MISDDLVDDFQGYMYAFHPINGFILAWHSNKDINTTRDAQLARFINFTSGLITQGKDATTMIHGPFIIRELHSYLALIKPLNLQQTRPPARNEPRQNDLTHEISFFLVILYPVTIDSLITGSSRRQLSRLIDSIFSTVDINEFDENIMDRGWKEIKQWWTRHLYQVSSSSPETGHFVRLGSILQRSNDLLKINNCPQQWMIGGNHKILSHLLPEVFHILISKFPDINFSFQHEKNRFSRLTLEYLEIECRYNEHFPTAPFRDFNVFFIRKHQEWEELQENMKKNLKKGMKSRFLIISTRDIETSELDKNDVKSSPIIEHVTFDWLEDVTELPDIIADLFQEELERVLKEENS